MAGAQRPCDQIDGFGKLFLEDAEARARIRRSAAYGAAHEQRHDDAETGEATASRWRYSRTTPDTRTQARSGPASP
jgi:hypothetical protein